MKVTAVVLTRNNKDSLPDCLESLDFCDEIILIDDFSKDTTARIARIYGAIVYKRKLSNDYAAQRNYALVKAKNDWVLFIDSDEAVTAELADEIKSLSKNEKTVGYLIPRSDRFLGKNLIGGEAGKIYLLRLGKRDSGKWRRGVHEHWDIKGMTKKLKGKIAHNPHKKLATFVEKINVYSQLHAKENEKEGKRSSLMKIVSYPAFKFFLNFVFKGGYRDSTHGFVHAVLMSFHSFLSWSALWLNQRQNR